MATNNSNSAEQPATTHFPLAELNDASNKSGGTWLVDVYCPFNDTYEYQCPIIEVAFNSGTWWSIPANMSQDLYERHLRGEEDIGYVWDWGDDRTGSWVHEDQETTLNRYVINFDTKEQKTLTMGASEPFALCG